MNDTAIISIILGCMIGCAILYAVGMLIFIDIELYFLHFKLEKHPLLIQKIEDALKYLCESENIKVFNKTFEEINIKETDETKKAVGLYIYSLNPNVQKELLEISKDVKAMEAKYNMSYDVICRLQGVEPISEERLVIPRIELAHEKLIKYGMYNYYNTWFHELGHHFARKELGDNGGGEEVADKYAAKLIKYYLPSYFLLFFQFAYRFKKYGAILTNKEKFRAIINFLLYLRQKRNFDKTKNV